MASIKYKNGSSWNDLLLDIIYPIGSVYITADIQSPSSLFGGTWSQVQGYFVRGFSKAPATAGSSESKTDGANTVKLTNANLPKMQANFVLHGAGTSAGGTNLGSVSGSLIIEQSACNNRYLPAGNTTGANSVGSYIMGFGSDNNAHNNMPLYRNFYIYERTA